LDEIKMAILTISKNQFEKDIGKLDAKMQEKISMFGTPLEDITTEEIILEIFPNRPDLLSYQGFKRSFLSFLGKKKGLKKYKLHKPEKNYAVKIDSSLKNIRPYTACAIVRGLKLNDARIKELIDIQEKLHLTIGRKRKKLAIGIYPLEKIKIPITYKALEPDKISFLPLESEREMSGLEILQRHPAGKEYAHLLAGKAKFPIFIDANKNILSMPPIINSQLTGKVTSQTHEVFIECSGFDFEILQKCLNIITTCLADMGGSIYQMELKYSKKEITPTLTPQKMKLSLQNTNKLLGLNLNEKKLKELIEIMGHNYSHGTVEIPAWRTDVLHEVDLIEDAAIAYGYDKFVPEIPKISTIGKEDSTWALKRKISELLVGLNMIEISNYHLTNKKDQFIKMGLQEKQIKNVLEVQESKTEYNLLRENLSHYLLKILSENVDSEYPQKIFETGIVFESKEPITEKENLAAALTPGYFTEARQILEYLFKMIGLKVELKEPKNPSPHFIEGRVAEIFLNSTSIGEIGEIHPKILKLWKLKMPVSLFEIDLKEILKT
jgi:phenylalanyl-tRNA synthetase beta chain